MVVLAAVDGSNASDDVILSSAELAGRSGAELHVVHVVEPIPEAGASRGVLTSLPDVLEGGHAVLEEMTARARQRFVGRIVGHLAAGTPKREILQVAADLQADVIVVGTHGKTAIERWLLGSTSEQIVRRASCPVVVARAKDYGQVAAPEIEPPCPDCVALQAETRGQKLWCQRHDRSSKHPRGRLHYEVPQPFAVGSSLLRPEG
jgi:nucleotide-binding universal stress UspA family protein